MRRITPVLDDPRAQPLALEPGFSSQNLQSVMRCHVGAFEAMGGVPEELLYDRIKAAVIGKGEPSGSASSARPHRQRHREAVRSV